MFPFPDIPSIPIAGPIQLHPFGLLVATGILVGSWFSQRRARAVGVSIAEIRSGVAWGTVSGFVGAHLVAIGFYTPDRLKEDGPLLLLKVWDGISSFGGFLGAIVGLFIFYGHRQRPVGTQVAVLALPFVATYLTTVHHLAGIIASSCLLWG